MDGPRRRATTLTHVTTHAEAAMAILSDLSADLQALGIDPLLGGFVLGVLVTLLLVLLLRRGPSAGSQPAPPKASAAPELHASRLEIRVRENGQERELSTEESAQLQAYLREGRKLEGIKYLRQLTGLGLKEAKDLLEVIERARR